MKSTNKTVLVAGAAGFIGSHLCGLLLERGYRVIGVDNFITGNKENLASFQENKNFQFKEANVIQAFNPGEKIDYIFNLASPASPPAYYRFPVETLMVNSVGTFNLLELARANSARFIITSTSEVYGDPEEHPQTEGYWGHVNPVGPRSCYDEGKRFAEALIVHYQRKYNISAGIARVFNTYGPRMDANDGRVIPNFINQALEGKPLTIYGDGKQTRSYCYVDDLIHGLFSLMQSDNPGPVNLGNPDEYTILETAEIIKKLTCSSAPLLFNPLPQDDPVRRKPDISRAKTVLGWEPKVKLEDGLRKTIEFFTRSAIKAGL